MPRLGLETSPWIPVRAHGHGRWRGTPRHALPAATEGAFAYLAGHVACHGYPGDARPFSQAGSHLNAGRVDALEGEDLLPDPEGQVFADLLCRINRSRAVDSGLSSAFGYHAGANIL